MFSVIPTGWETCTTALLSGVIALWYKMIYFCATDEYGPEWCQSFSWSVRMADPRMFGDDCDLNKVRKIPSSVSFWSSHAKPKVFSRLTLLSLPWPAQNVFCNPAFEPESDHDEIKEVFRIAISTEPIKRPAARTYTRPGHRHCKPPQNGLEKRSCSKRA